MNLLLLLSAESADLFSPCFFLGGLVMTSPGTSLQVLIAILIMLSHLLIVLKLSPYENQSEDWTSFLASLTLTLTTIGGFALMTSPEFQSETNSGGMGVVLVAISVLCLVSQIGITIFMDCGLLGVIVAQRNRRKKQ